MRGCVSEGVREGEQVADSITCVRGWGDERG